MKTYRGYPGTRRVTVDDEDLDPAFDLAVHSPDGFMWGYHGSGPAQLALAILLDYTKSTVFTVDHYQEFKDKFVSAWPMNEPWTLTGDQLEAFVTSKRGEAWNDGDVEFL